MIREVGSFLHMREINLRLKQKCLYEGESGNSGVMVGESNPIYSAHDGVTDGMGREGGRDQSHGV